MGVSPVVVFAHTGTAARNIRGTTIHTLLHIFVTTFVEYVPPSNFAKS